MAETEFSPQTSNQIFSLAKTQRWSLSFSYFALHKTSTIFMLFLFCILCISTLLFPFWVFYLFLLLLRWFNTKHTISILIQKLLFLRVDSIIDNIKYLSMQIGLRYIS